MKVFISWSGPVSKAVAESLYDWLPRVIQAVQPWLSTTAIDKGARWSTDIATQLEQSDLGLICLTPDNLEAPWILFESGALSKALHRSYVCPYLFRIEPSDLQGPLVQFQASKAEKEDTKKLVQTINRAQGATALPNDIVDDAFEVWWPKLDACLKNIPDTQQEQKPNRDEREILEEMLELVRVQSRNALEPDKDIIYKLIRTEVNNFKSYIMSTMVNKDAVLQLEENRLQQDIDECSINILAIELEMTTMAIRNKFKESEKIEELLTDTKLKLDDLESRAITIKPDSLARIQSIKAQYSQREAAYSSLKKKIEKAKAITVNRKPTESKKSQKKTSAKRDDA
jgi:hypothetical protein